MIPIKDAPKFHLINIHVYLYFIFLDYGDCTIVVYEVADANPIFTTTASYAVGSKSFWPDQLLKVTEIKQLCCFST